MSIRVFKLLEKRKMQIEDEKLRAAFLGFAKEYLQGDCEGSVRNLGIKLYKLIDLIRETTSLDLDWKTLCTMVLNNFDINNEIRSFYVYLLKNNIYEGDYKNYLEENLWIFGGMYTKNKISLVYSSENPQFLTKVMFLKDGKQCIKRIDLGFNGFLHDILTRFLQICASYNSCLSYFIFYSNFKNSLGKYFDNIRSICDFNYKVFEKQFQFFKDYTNDRVVLTLITNFYIYLTDMEAGKQIFNIGDPVDYFFLRRAAFINEFKEGYRLVFFNPFETAPIYDKWILVPGPFEKWSTEMKAHGYYSIDFLKFRNQYLRGCLKRWFWEREVALNVRIRELRKVNFYFNNFIKSKDPLIVFDKTYKVTANDIMLYKSYIEGNKTSIYSVRNYLYALLSFLRYCDENSLIQVDALAIEFLRLSYKVEEKGGLKIPENELKAISDLLNQKYCDGKYIDKIMVTIFHLAITTKLRISEVTGLNIKCINEDMKKGYYSVQYVSQIDETEDEEFAKVKTKRKLRFGEEQGIPINTYQKRLIEEILLLTEDLRKNCISEDTKKYLFIYRGKSKLGKISEVSPSYFNRYFRNILEELGIPKKYSAQNLRDTYMTYVINYGRKNKWTIEQFKSATGHKKLSTTLKNYYEKDIVNYLEAIYQVSGIGNITIEGQVKETFDCEGVDLERLVANKCGYCELNKCDPHRDIDHMLCPYFVVTLDRLPYLESQIKEIDIKINQQVIEHEKEHLIAIKKLFVAYVRELYFLQKGKIKNENEK